MPAGLKLLSAATLALSVAACAPGATVQNGPLPPAGDDTPVKVQNNNWADMTVYVDYGGTRTRLGLVTSMTSKILRIPAGLASLASSLRLIADPVGSPRVHVTSPVHVQPGQLLEFTIENQVNISSVAVWNR